jgi:hypothetical protein
MTVARTCPALGVFAVVVGVAVGLGELVPLHAVTRRTITSARHRVHGTGVESIGGHRGVLLCVRGASWNRTSDLILIRDAL